MPRGEPITLNFNARGDYWCSGCWTGDDGKRERRLDKLRALADNPAAAKSEREVARMRITEILERGGDKRAEAWKRHLRTETEQATAALAEAEARLRALYEERMKKAAERRRRGRNSLQTLALNIGGYALIMLAGKLATTSVFYGTLGIGAMLIACWFSLFPSEKRVSMRQAVLFLVWLSMMAWLWAPLESMLCGMFETLA